MRVLLAGDWHGNTAASAAAVGLAADEGCAAVLQLGDFGLWPGREDAWLDHVDGAARRAGVEVYWIDGNHENHSALRTWLDAARPGGVVPMRSRVLWASRGARWEWGGIRFGALGGAVSADRFLRREGRNWWPEEAATPADADRLGDGPLDVLVTHAAPTSYPPPPRALRLPADILADAAAHRAVLDEAVRRTKPRLVVHGHYHVRLQARMDGWRIEGLAHDKAPLSDSCAVLSLPSLEVRTPAAP